MCGMIYPTFHIKQSLWYKKGKTNNKHVLPHSFLTLHSMLYLQILKKNNVRNEVTALGFW